MKISKRGLDLVKAFEGCLKPIGGGRFKPYYCPAGVLTIGWGHTNHHGRKFNTSSIWTQAECDAELVSDMKTFEDAVNRRVRVPLTQNQFDALVSFTYNCGEGNLAKSSLLRKLNNGDYQGAARDFHLYVRGGGRVLPGLVRRRASEALLFQGISDYNYDGRPDANQRPRPENRVEEGPAVTPPPSDAPTLPNAMPQGVDAPEEVKDPMQSKTLWATVVGTLSTLGAFLTDWRVVTVLCMAGILGAFLLIGRERLKKIWEQGI